MNVWLCPIKQRSQQLIRRHNIFGAPRNASKIMEEVKIGNLLIIYLFDHRNCNSGNISVLYLSFIMKIETFGEETGIP